MGPQLGGKKIWMYCNNNGVCQILHHHNSKSPTVAALLCMPYCLSVKFGCVVSTTHLPGVDNTWADCLSGGWLEKFYASCPQAAPFPTDIGGFYWTLVTRQTHDLDIHTATWLHSLLTSSKRIGHVARLDPD